MTIARLRPAIEKAVLRLASVRGVLMSCLLVPPGWWRSEDRLWLDDGAASSLGARIARAAGLVERKNLLPWRSDPFVRLTNRGRILAERLVITEILP
jgi:hypothetical protein